MCNNYPFFLTVASLLSSLHQLKEENLDLETSVDRMVQRRDHLLAVRARLLALSSLTVNSERPEQRPEQRPDQRPEQRPDQRPAPPATATQDPRPPPPAAASSAPSTTGKSPNVPNTQ